MGILKKIISALRTEDEGLYAQKPPFDEDGNPANRRHRERIDFIRSEFCVFLAAHGEELNMEKAPFLMANLTNISTEGAAFSCFSKTACTPYIPDLEDELKVSSTIWLVPNLKLDIKSCGAASCSSEESKNPIEMEHGEPIKATALWVKTDQFGCAFKENKDKIIKLIESLKK